MFCLFVRKARNAASPNFLVLEEHRGKGIGSMLLLSALSWIRAKDIDAAIRRYDYED
jgi:GNAT superfamily N-acetyltransferase